jgi:hypothetical protein
MVMTGKVKIGVGACGTIAKVLKDALPYCIAGNRTWLYRLPQSQKQCICLVRRTAIWMKHEKISSSVLGLA